MGAGSPAQEPQRGQPHPCLHAAQQVAGEQASDKEFLERVAGTGQQDRRSALGYLLLLGDTRAQQCGDRDMGPHPHTA